MLPKDITEDLIKRIRTVKGQLGGIEKMFDEGKDPNQIINQIQSSRRSIE